MNSLFDVSDVFRNTEKFVPGKFFFVSCIFLLLLSIFFAIKTVWRINPF